MPKKFIISLNINIASNCTHKGSVHIYDLQFHLVPQFKLQGVLIADNNIIVCPFIEFVRQKCPLAR